MFIAIVGATGVLGRNLIPLLCKEGMQVRALARSAAKINTLFGGSVEAVAMDLLQPGIEHAFGDILKGCDAVVHIATAIPADPNNQEGWTQTARLRTEGARTLITATQEAGIGFYLQQSIELPYPDRGDQWIDEQTPLDDSPERAEINRPVIEMEAMVRTLPTGSMGWCILRGGTFVGPDTFQDHTIARLKAGEEVIPCDGRYFVPYVHVSDMARALFAALRQQPAGAILNINAEPVWRAEYLDRLAQLNGAASPPRNPQIPCPPSIRSSSRAAQDILGWKPEMSIYPR